MKVKCSDCGKEFTAEDGQTICDSCTKNKKQHDSAQSAPIRHYQEDVFFTVTPENMEEIEEWGYVKKFEEDDKGFLSGKAAVTNVGVFSVMLPNGTIERRLRPPEEVFNHESLETLRMAPLVDNHPMENGEAIKVTAENAKELVIGTLGTEIDYDAYRVYAPITIQTADEIAAVKAGKRALSCGYTFERDEKSGNWMGVDYDVIQRNIKYNHVAIVDRGRAGDDAVMQLDGANQPVGQLIKPNPSQKEKTMSKISIDSVEVEVDANVAAHVSTLQTKLTAQADAAKEVQSALQGQLDSELDKSKSLQAQIDGIPALVETAVNARLALVSQADGLGVKVTVAQSDADIRKAVILAAFPSISDESKAQLDSEPMYLKARFDGAVEHLTQKQADSTSAVGAGEASRTAVPTIQKDSRDTLDPMQAYENDQANQWRTTQGEVLTPFNS